MSDQETDVGALISRARRGQRVRTVLRRVLIAVTAASAVALALVAWLNCSDVPPGGVTRARLLLVLVTAAVASFGTVWPLLRLWRQRATQRHVLSSSTAQDGSLNATRATEARTEMHVPQTLAGHTLHARRNTAFGSLAPTWLLLAMSAVGALMLLGLFWIILAAPASLGL